jgi:hypothetical protein
VNVPSLRNTLSRVRHYLPQCNNDPNSYWTAPVHGCVRDISNGKTTYELELLKDGRSRDVSFDSDGNILEVEEQIDLASLPKPVAEAIHKEAGTGHIGKIESLTRGGTLVSYETTVTRNGKRREIAFRPDGSVMKPD